MKVVIKLSDERGPDDKGLCQGRKCCFATQYGKSLETNADRKELRSSRAGRHKTE